MDTTLKHVNITEALYKVIRDSTIEDHISEVIHVTITTTETMICN